MNDAATNAQRLYVEFDLEQGRPISCTKEHAHYLGNVLRLGVGDHVLLFNGRDGEWLGRISEKSKKTCVVEPVEKIREQTPDRNLTYLFAPIKRSRLDYMVQKATEMGASELVPVRTAYCQVSRVNEGRMIANTVEAAEQCGILNVPIVSKMQDLGTLLENWDDERVLIFCDEGAEQKSPLEALQGIAGKRVAVLIGPEGGFSPVERRLLLGCPFVVAISLGPRIMRADTAAVAALALVNAVQER